MNLYTLHYELVCSLSSVIDTRRYLSFTLSISLLPNIHSLNVRQPNRMSFHFPSAIFNDGEGNRCESRGEFHRSPPLIEYISVDKFWVLFCFCTAFNLRF
ncbi:hypothetical protein Hdeb2414_s0003g00102701 [Helianthus debilis subsp. tardiflorus]